MGRLARGAVVSCVELVTGPRIAEPTRGEILLVRRVPRHARHEDGFEAMSSRASNRCASSSGGITALVRAGSGEALARWLGGDRVIVLSAGFRRATLWVSIWFRPVTQQYLIGQFSVLLEDMAPSHGDRLAAAVHDLRGEVESSAVQMLPKLAREAMILSDMICWGALERGDAIGFCRCAKAAVALGAFADAAGLLPD